jgi:hypothetical protein
MGRPNSSRVTIRAGSQTMMPKVDPMKAPPRNLKNHSLELVCSEAIRMPPARAPLRAARGTERSQPSRGFQRPSLTSSRHRSRAAQQVPTTSVGSPVTSVEGPKYGSWSR